MCNTKSKVIIDCRIVNPNVEGYERKDIIVENGKIARISESNMVDYNDYDEIIDAKDNMVTAGFIDTHIHGAVGRYFMEGSAEVFDKAFNFLVSTGVTGFLPTTSTVEITKLKEAIVQMKRIYDSLQTSSLKESILGIHMEGPFINPEKGGAQSKENICQPDLTLAKDLLESGRELIKIVTLAPEMEGIHDIIALLKSKNIIVSAGHTNATYEDIAKAHRIGLDHITHMYNAVKGFHHREVGTVGAAFILDGVCCELIMDGIHVSPSAAKILKKIKTPDKIILISDSSGFTGLPDGIYTRFDGQKVKIKNESVRLLTGGLAGSLLTINKAVYNAVKFMECSINQAVKMASYNPAKLLNVHDRKGSIEEGKDADLIIIDDKIDVRLTMIKGNIVYRRDIL